MSRAELVERFSLDRVGASAATLDYAKLDWMNGVYLRALSPDEYADRLITWLSEQGYDWPEERVRAAAPLVQEKIARLGEFPGVCRLSLRGRRARPGAARRLDPRGGGAQPRGDRAVARRRDRGRAQGELCVELGQKPRQVFQPIRVAVTGSKVSPGLYESLELLGRDESLARIRRAAQVASPA